MANERVATEWVNGKKVMLWRVHTLLILIMKYWYYSRHNEKLVGLKTKIQWICKSLTLAEKGEKQRGFSTENKNGDFNKSRLFFRSSILKLRFTTTIRYSELFLVFFRVFRGTRISVFKIHTWKNGCETAEEVLRGICTKFPNFFLVYQIFGLFYSFSLFMWTLFYCVLRELKQVDEWERAKKNVLYSLCKLNSI